MKTTIHRLSLPTVLVWACLSAATLVAQDDLKTKLEEYMAACVEADRFNGSVLARSDARRQDGHQSRWWDQRFLDPNPEDSRAEALRRRALERLKVVDAQLTFVRDKEGNVTQVVLHQGGRDQEAKRVVEENR